MDKVIQLFREGKIDEAAEHLHQYMVSSARVIYEHILEGKHVELPVASNALEEFVLNQLQQEIEEFADDKKELRKEIARYKKLNKTAAQESTTAAPVVNDSEGGGND